MEYCPDFFGSRNSHEGGKRKDPPSVGHVAHFSDQSALTLWPWPSVMVFFYPLKGPQGGGGGGGRDEEEEEMGRNVYCI